MIRLRPPTIDGPALPMTGWKATAYPSSDMAHGAIDGKSQAPWTTQGAQGPTNWFAVDMKRPQKFHQIVLDTGGDANAYPRGYAVYLSADGDHWGSSVVRGEGQAPITIIALGPQTARYVKVVQTRQGVTDPWTLSSFTLH
ncbi:hypothetical protein CCAX7_59730 [Capsulimonas corticalis]|uniref:Uncharacterized protein n=2 Tax=Capsulimonas corticalis TaxID=2219043 RepID=A0A402CZN3_9BACT|nr:hypothetical protein CCAX7_59730 [Capsulimonas corticalis]